MKPIHLLFLVVLAVGVGIVLSSLEGASTYVTFGEAKTLAEEGESQKVHVVGQLYKNEAGQIQGMRYEPTVDPNHFEFVMIDDSLKVQKVVALQPKPADIEQSEKVVVAGHYKGDLFIAEEILMKCPSKYVDENLEAEEATIY